MPIQGLFVHHISMLESFVHHISMSGAFVLYLPFQGTNFSLFSPFRVISFEHIGLSRFRRILESFANYHSGASIYARAFATGICDFIIFFVSITTYGKNR